MLYTISIQTQVAYTEMKNKKGKKSVTYSTPNNSL